MSCILTLARLLIQVLGLLLFIIYVNDLEKAARDALMDAFADDTRLSKAIRIPW